MPDPVRRSPVDRLVGPVRDAILDSVDPNAVLDRIDVDGLLDRVDPDRLLDRVDPNRLLDRVDPDRLLDRVDPERLLARVDVDGVVRRVDVDRIVSASTGRVAGSLVDVVRRQLVGLDTIVIRTTHRLLGRDPDALPLGPAALIEPDDARSRYEVTGRYAGPITQLLAYGADVAAAFALFTGVSAGLGYLAALLLGISIDPAEAPGLVGTAILAVVLFTYHWGSLAIAGRTPAMGLLGLRLVRRDGRPVSGGRAAVRTLVLPLSALVFGLGFAGLLVGRERRGLHDVAAGSVVVTDWGDRPASLPTPLGDWLARHDADTAA